MIYATPLPCYVFCYILFQSDVAVSSTALKFMVVLHNFTVSTLVILSLCTLLVVINNTGFHESVGDQQR